MTREGLSEEKRMQASCCCRVLLLGNSLMWDWCVITVGRLA